MMGEKAELKSAHLIVIILIHFIKSLCDSEFNTNLAIRYITIETETPAIIIRIHT